MIGCRVVPKLSLLYKDCIDFTFTSCEQVMDWMLENGADPTGVQVCSVDKAVEANPASASRCALTWG
jgi:hypothetical protein